MSCNAALLVLGCLRSHPHKAYVIFFRYEGDALEIARVIESHRDIPLLFDDERT